MASNASDFAVTSYSVEGMPEFSYTSTLDPSEREESSSVRELLAIERTLDHMAQWCQPKQNSYSSHFLHIGLGMPLLISH
jgi:hypothetical protein